MRNEGERWRNEGGGEREFLEFAHYDMKIEEQGSSPGSVVDDSPSICRIDGI